MKVLFVTNADVLSRNEVVDIIANQIEDSQVVFGTMFEDGCLGASFNQPASDTPIFIKILEENGFITHVDEYHKLLVVNATNNRKLKRAVKYN